jgi:hypothetical protein
LKNKNGNFNQIILLKDHTTLAKTGDCPAHKRHGEEKGPVAKKMRSKV